MKIVAFASSYNPESVSDKALKVAVEAARQAGAEVEIFSLQDRSLPVYGTPGCFEDANVQYWKQITNEANAFIMASPEYHNGPSGAWKNALDFIGGDQIRGKAVGFIASAGGPVATNTLNQMITIIRSLHGYVVPQVGAVPGGTQFTAEGKFANADLQARFEAVGTGVVKLANGLLG